MAADKYRHAEDEYFKLRGQFDTGRLSQEQFDEKLRALMLQDEQGRYWMLGADSGKWYYYDGTKWVQGDPYPGASMPPPVVLAAMPASSPPPAAPASVSPAPAPPATKRGFPIVPVLIVLALLALGVAGFLIFQNRERIFVAQQPPQITPVLPPTITRAPSPTAPVFVPTLAPQTLPPLATAIPATDVPTDAPPSVAPPTNAPAITVIVVTDVPPPTIELPTLLPTATTPPTQPPTVAPTKPPATATKAPPTNTVVPTCPNGVCVTNLQFSPAAPKRNQDVTFTANFLNSTGDTKSYNWLILVYRQGQTKGFGESAAYNISVPPGVSTFSITHTVVKGPGGCEPFYARAGWKISAFEKYEFPNVSGEPATANFDVCP
jgi:hypothetical protein